MMRSLMVSGVMAVAGCAAAPGVSSMQVHPPVTLANAAVVPATCIDPPLCTNTNGTGVYTAEDGHAGIGRFQLMITHFINNGPDVGFQGRYYHPDLKQWLMLASPGRIDAASADSVDDLSVVSVTESATAPSWTLIDRAQPGAPPRIVTGAGLYTLRLYLSFTVPDLGQAPLGNDTKPAGAQLPDEAVASVTVHYILEFGPPPPVPPDTIIRQPVTAYDLHWRDASAPAVATQYCTDADGNPDGIVFQQGIDVNPVMGWVARGTDTTGFVSLSCRRGALAVVYSWGYSHRDAFHFDSGVQMKRASYCADAQFYTKAGTQIDITDDLVPRSIARLEAWWTPRGATCLNRANMRHPELASSKGFGYACAGRPLLPCLDHPSPDYVGDGPATPAR